LRLLRCDRGVYGVGLRLAQGAVGHQRVEHRITLSGPLGLPGFAISSRSRAHRGLQGLHIFAVDRAVRDEFAHPALLGCGDRIGLRLRQGAVGNQVGQDLGLLGGPLRLTGFLIAVVGSLHGLTDGVDIAFGQGAVFHQRGQRTAALTVLAALLAFTVMGRCGDRSTDRQCGDRGDRSAGDRELAGAAHAASFRRG